MSKLRDRDSDKRANNAAGRDFSEALARGLAVIQVFNLSQPALSLSDIARAVDLPRATVRRTLLTLVDLGFMAENGRLYSLQPSILKLAAAYLGANPITAILQPLCEKLAQELQATFSVAILDGKEAVMVAYASPRNAQVYGVIEGIGLRLPAFCSAVGRVLLAGLEQSVVMNFLNSCIFEKITIHTITEKKKIQNILEKTKKDGYALVDQEAEIGYRSLAVPLYRKDGCHIAALNVGLRVEQANTETMKNIFLPRLISEAENIRNQLLK
ncbi:helix-turn-helix domain-containing protein [Acetobacter persici]|uniref:IclR family transcriptional regulator domain-containing protein n=1 Tax=Acetobacter persici TaxID=1076596 RepID=UPI0020CF329B|nr:helix-turn-helix domain-containing protein [Acetobacter persici]